jgi:hypothetical protein
MNVWYAPDEVQKFQPMRLLPPRAPDPQCLVPHSHPKPLPLPPPFCRGHPCTTACPPPRQLAFAHRLAPPLLDSAPPRTTTASPPHVGLPSRVTQHRLDRHLATQGRHRPSPSHRWPSPRWSSAASTIVWPPSPSSSATDAGHQP